MSNDDIARLLSGADEPRQLPEELRSALEDSLLLSTAGALADAASPRSLPPDLDARLVGALAAARVDRLATLKVGRFQLTTLVAIAASVLLVAASVAAAVHDSDRSVAPLPSQSNFSSPDLDDLVVPGPTPTTSTAVAPPPPPPSAPSLALVAFDSCTQLLDRLKQHAAAAVGPYGLPGSMYGAAPAAGGAAAGGDGTASPAFSDTNVQEAGVDEDDMVKTDGRRVFHLYRSGEQQAVVLRSMEVGDGGLVERGRLRLDGMAQSMFLADSKLLVLGRTFRDDRTWAAAWIVEARDPAAMRVIWSQEVEGRIVAARMIGGVARVVVHTLPKGPQPVQPRDNTPEEQERATQANRDAVARSKLEDWVPLTRIVDSTGGSARVTEGRACACESTMTTSSDFSGFGHLTVVTINSSDPGSMEPASVQGAGETVYASASALYVATAAWRADGMAVASAERTQLHRFDLPTARPARYVASGEVPGTVLNQFSMSEFRGHLRVATTLGQWDGTGASESFVTVLTQNAERLVQVGQVGGLGRGERIYSARFIGDTGYVVTFRQTDPLYVLDLSDPKQPKVTGELKILGYSAYLHPIGDGYLLGIGQDATEDGRRTGTQLSVFDVRDPHQPRRVQQASLPGSHSAAEFDHHAFLYWPTTAMAVIPVVDQREGESPFVGAAVYTASRDQLEERGRISHSGREGTTESYVGIDRSVVIGERLLTFSNAGVLLSDLDSLADVQWLPY